MGETRVDLEHLLEDLWDAYPYSISDTILTEIIANSLDSEEERQLSNLNSEVQEEASERDPLQRRSQASSNKDSRPLLFARWEYYAWVYWYNLL